MRPVLCALVLLSGCSGCDAPVVDVRGGSGGYRPQRAPLPETPAQWVAVAQEHMARYDHGAAIRTIERALVHFPDDHSLQKFHWHLLEWQRHREAQRKADREREEGR